MVLVEGGDVFTMGSNCFEQLGTGDKRDTSSPIRISVDDGRAVDVSAGWWHTTVVVESEDSKCVVGATSGNSLAVG